ncbi:MAG: hybrid sensor histidine kinase/response regulator [Lysobacter sp.]|nr:MAG: hybrid sensor histidine kinase/response regulator [Lysobacter sp.]
MSNGTAIDGTAAGLDEFQSRLDTLVMLLQAAHQVSDMAEPALVHEMIGTLQASAADAGLPGVGELLRSWKAALHDRLRGETPLSGDDLLQTTLWFMTLQEHVAGRLDANGREMLARLPEGIAWLPQLSPALVRAILRKLETSSHTATDASASLAEEDATRAFAPSPADATTTPQTAGDASAAVDASDASPADRSSLASSSPHDNGIAPPSNSVGGLDVTAALLAQLPPEFLAAFPPGALDDLPPDVLDALLSETRRGGDDAFAMTFDTDTQAASKNDGANAFIGIETEPTSLTDAGQDPSLASTAETVVDAIDEASAASDATLADDTTAEVADAPSDDAFADTQAPSETRLFLTDDAGADADRDANAVAFAHDSAPDETAAPSATHTTTEAALAEASSSDAALEPAFAFDSAAFDSVAFDGIARDDAPRANDASAATIWIGQEELDLTRQAIVEQVLPLAQAWADTPDAEANAPILDELTYQCQLVVNVMELIGTHTLAHGMDAIRVGIETRDPAITPETVAIWCSVLLAAIETPNADSAESLTIASLDVPALDDAWRAALIDEFARVRVGLDPALIAERKTQALPEDVALSPADDVLPSVLDGMLRELPGNAGRFGASVRALAETGAFDAIDEARRVAHTLKGDANTVGVRGLANITHALEDILIVLAKRPELLNAECADLLIDAGDTVEEIADHLLGRGPAPSGLLDTYQHVLDTANALADGADAVPAKAASSAPQTTAEALASDDGDASAMPRADADTIEPASGMAASGIQSLNVPSELLDELQRLAGESLVTARQIDRQLESLGGLHRDQRQGVRSTHELMGRLDDLVALRGAALQSTAQKTGAELDPLEIDQYNELHVISRQLLEAHDDSAEFMRRIERTMNALAELRNEQEQLNRELQRTVLRTRTVPFSQISARLQRIVRQTSKQVLKPVRLELVGESLPLDAELLERVVEPLAHVLRNAIDHGIESPSRRRDIGKPEEGRIEVRVGLQGDSALIDIQDDGAGLDFAAIRERALEAGLLREDQDADERLLTRMILLPGFSTRSAATEVSGRGIGMDVVNQRIAALRGAMSIVSERGVGMRVSLRLPVTQTLANVIVARGQRQVSAVVASSVERVVSFAAGECLYDAHDGRMWVMLGDERVPALPIETFYGASADPRMWLDAAGVGLQVRDGDGRVSVVLVQGIDEVRSTVVKPIGAYLPPIPAVRGITQLGDGGLAPVIDVDVLLQSLQSRALGTGALTLADTAPATRVVVADDSLSVRRALEQLMQDAGFEVETARDGFEALAAIQAKPTHAVLVDLEMPRMNGLEVTRNLRTHAETRDLPVVMITSRATEKHQAMAEQAGVTRMLGKPFSEDSLVALVRELIAERAGTADSAS